MKSIKMVVVGDEGVGKTSLLMTYTSQNFPAENAVKTFDNYSPTIILDGKPINLSLWDTAGAAEYDHLRPNSYSQTDAFLICFSLVEPQSLEHVRNKWNPEIIRYCPHVPILLIGTKLDLREADLKQHSGSLSGPSGGSGIPLARRLSNVATIVKQPDKLQQIHQIQQQRRATCVDHALGYAMAKEIDAVKYIECSSLTKKNLNVVFDEAIRCVLYPECKEHHERNCQKCDKEPKGNMCIVQ